MKGKEKLTRQLAAAAQSMMQGSVSDITRQCGDPSCACFRDPARRHGPHLYFKFNHQGKSYSIYVPPSHVQAVKHGHTAWRRFLDLGSQISVLNRQPFLKNLDHEKDKARSARQRTRRKTGD